MSRFVSGGTDDQPNAQRDEEWLKAQQELDAKSLAKQLEGKQGEGKSLYETLQANKAAKQDAFEESIRLTNQFRALDEDEIEFLDSVNASTRAKEAEVKKDTREQLDAFRKQQEDAEKAAKQAERAEEPAAAESWTTSGPRKRKKGKDKEGIGGIKVRRTSSQAAKPEELSTVPAMREPPKHDIKAEPPTSSDKAPTSQQPAKPASVSPAPPIATPGLGLGGYSSDED